MSTESVLRSRGGGGGPVFRHLRLPRPPSSSPYPGGRQIPPVCRFWLQGRCTRCPCPFLHSREPPSPTPGRPHPPPSQQQHRQSTPPQPRRRLPPGSHVWRNPNLVPVPSSGDSATSGEDRGGKKEITVTSCGGDDGGVKLGLRPRLPPGSHVWRNPNLVLVSSSSDSPTSGQDRGGKKGGTVTPSCGDDGGVTPCPRPTIPPPPAGDDAGVTPTGGGESETLVSCPPSSTPPPPEDDGGDDKPSTVLLRQEETVQHDLAPPPPPTVPLSDQGEEDGSCSSFSFVTALGLGDGSGHEEPITGIALPSGSRKLFSGSTDGTVRVWDCDSGECVEVIQLGRGPVTCVIADGAWVFVGTHSGVATCCTLTGTGVPVPGSSGHMVHSLCTNDDMLFAGVSDGTVFSWKLTIRKHHGGVLRFRPRSSLSGHTSPVISLVVGRGRLYSGSLDCTIRVWDVQTLQCCHTLSGHGGAVTSVLCWTDFLLSSSLDGTIKLWGISEASEGKCAGESGGYGTSLLEQLEVMRTQHEEHGVLLLNDACDSEDRPVLMCSLSDGTVRLYDLPSFSDRGMITSGGEVRSMRTGPHGFFFTGGVTGQLGVWRWSQQK